MTGTELEQAIDKVGFASYAEASRFFEVNDSTVRRWITKQHEIPRSVEIVLRLMERYHLTPNGVAIIMGTRK